MGISNRFRRAVRPSDSSDDLSSQSDKTSSPTTANTSQSSLLLPTTSSIPDLTFTKTATNNTTTSSKLFPWTSSSSTKSSKAEEKALKKQERKEEKARAKAYRKNPHPSLKPMTAQNLKHQEMLSHFTMTFGAQHFNPSSISLKGVSPCCTRPGSVIDFAVEHHEGDVSA